MRFFEPSFLLFRFTSLYAKATYVGTALLPHGDFALDPAFCAYHTKQRVVADQIANASRQASRWLLQTKPDILFLTTPHGLQLNYDYGIYHSRRGSGSVTLGQDLLPPGSDPGICSSKVKTPYDVAMTDLELADPSVSEKLLEWLKQRQPYNYPVSAIYSPNDDTSIPLFWGEIIPLRILQELALQNQSRTAVRSHHQLQQQQPVLPKPLIWTFPHRRYDHATDMVPELLQLGADIMTWIRQRPERIAVLVSGDLSHTHLANGPYGYSNASSPFDAAIATWGGGNDKNRRHVPCHFDSESALLKDARSLQPEAMSCGFTGYVLWHGMMDCHHNASSSRYSFQSTLFGDGNVTYYGMCSAIFENVVGEQPRIESPAMTEPKQVPIMLD